MPQDEPKKVRIVTLGCAKNEVDSEEIAGVLAGQGWSVDGSQDAELTIINTCGFLESAKRESIEAIKSAVAAKKGRVVVAGCLAQRMGAELQRLAPGADANVVATRLRLGDDFAFELDTVAERLGPAQMVGCNTYGQIARAEGQFSGFHHCTAVVLVIAD